jgi:hypothetical protein
MAWQLHNGAFFLRAGQAAQFFFSFGGAYQGPQFVDARVDRTSGHDPNGPFLVIQWHGIQNRDAPVGTEIVDYQVGVWNPSSVDITFRLEGGGVT